MKEYPKMEEMDAMRRQVLAHQMAKQTVLIEFLEHSLSHAKSQQKTWKSDYDCLQGSIIK